MLIKFNKYTEAKRTRIDFGGGRTNDWFFEKDYILYLDYVRGDTLYIVDPKQVMDGGDYVTGVPPENYDVLSYRNQEMVELWKKASQFIDEHKVRCPDSCNNDNVVINASSLVYDICEIVGYYKEEE